MSYSFQLISQACVLYYLKLVVIRLLSLSLLQDKVPQQAMLQLRAHIGCHPDAFNAVAGTRLSAAAVCLAEWCLAMSQ